MFDKMKQLYEMQKKAKDLQKQLENLRAEKSAQGGLLKTTVTGALRIADLSIDPSLLAPDQKENLERSLVSLVNDALADVQKLATAQAAGLMKDISF
jgi:DNA-binding YbaB/EbfC family protein